MPLSYIVMYCPTILQTRCVFVAFRQMVWLFRWMEQKHSYVHWSNSYKYHLLVSVIERLQRHGSKWRKLWMNSYEFVWIFIFEVIQKFFSTSSQNIPNWLKLLILLPQALTSTSNLRHHQLGLPDAKGTTFSSAKPSVAIPHRGGAGVFRTWDFKNPRKEVGFVSWRVFLFWDS